MISYKENILKGEKKMQPISRKELFTIPNLMGYFRILLIPFFAYVYCTANTDSEYYLAAAIIGLSGFTDLLDGKIARKYNMVTEFGKFLDPLADKLTQAALVFCLTTKYTWVWALVVIFVVKEGFMLVMGAIFLRKGKKLNGAMWFGKVCTAVLYLVMFLLLVFPNINIVAANSMIVLCGIIMVITLGLYVPVFNKMGKE